MLQHLLLSTFPLLCWFKKKKKKQERKKEQEHCTWGAEKYVLPQVKKKPVWLALTFLFSTQLDK